jgi:hypothetical protein
MRARRACRRRFGDRAADVALCAWEPAERLGLCGLGDFARADVEGQDAAGAAEEGAGGG